MSAVTIDRTRATTPPGPLPDPSGALPAASPRPVPDGVPAEALGRADLLWAAAILLSVPACGVLGALAGRACGGPVWMTVLALVCASLGGLATTSAWARRRARGTRTGLLTACGFLAPARSLWNLVWEIPCLAITQMAATSLIVSLVYESALRGDAEEAARVYSEIPFGLVLLCGVCVVGVLPLVEEVAFRRILQGALGRRLGVVPAVLLSAAAYGVLHLDPALMPGLAVLGLWLGFAAAWHRSLWAAWILHAVNNLLVFGLALALMGS